MNVNELDISAANRCGRPAGVCGRAFGGAVWPVVGGGYLFNLISSASCTDINIHGAARHAFARQAVS